MTYIERLDDFSPSRVTEGTAPTINRKILLGHREDASGNRVVKDYSQPRIDVGLINVGLYFAAGLLMPSKYPLAR